MVRAGVLRERERTCIGHEMRGACLMRNDARDDGERAVFDAAISEHGLCVVVEDIVPRTDLEDARKILGHRHGRRGPDADLSGMDPTCTRPLRELQHDRSLLCGNPNQLCSRRGMIRVSSVRQYPGELERLRITEEPQEIE